MCQLLLNQITVKVKGKLRSRHSIAPSRGCYTTNKELTVLADAWIDELSVHETDKMIQPTSMDHLSIAWMMQQTLPRIQIPMFNGSPMKWFKDLVYNLEHQANTQRTAYLLQHLQDGLRKVDYKWDYKILLEYYYTISGCIVALGQLSHTSDVYSSDILWQVIRKLPSKFLCQMGRILF